MMGQTQASADALFQAGDYEAAKKEYAALLKRYPSSQLFLYRYARCAQELKDYTTAATYFNKSGDRYVLKHFHLAEVYMHLWNASEAIEEYNKYLQVGKPDSQELAYVEKQLQQAETLQRYLRRVEKVQVLDSISLPLDGLWHSIALGSESGRYAQEDDGKICFMNQRGDRKWWVTHQENGCIVSSHQLLDEWTQPDTLPEQVNIVQKLAFPFVLTDGVTIYFSAQDEQGLGGYDLYVSRYNTNAESYTQAQNLGMPYNSPANDYLYAVDEVKGLGYLATDRFAGPDSVTVYTISLGESKAYWRGVSQDSLVAYARLTCSVPIVLSEEGDDVVMEGEKQPVVTHSVAPNEAIFFVINDSVVYTHIDDFASVVAKQKYEEWERAEQRYEKSEQELSALRAEYADADEEAQKKLAPTILQLEKSVSQLQMHCRALLLEVQQLEIRER